MKSTNLKILILVLLINFFSYSKEKANLIERQKYIMGTYITIKLPPKYSNLFKPAFDIFKQLDKKFSLYIPDSEINKINKNRCAFVSKDTVNIVKKALDICKRTDGYFNIAVGGITYDMFGFGTEKEKIPSENSLKAYSNLLSCDVVQIKNNRICIMKEGIKLDLGGIGKGYAVDKVARFFKKNDVNEGIILASGDIRCLSECETFIKNPFNEGIVIKLFLDKDTSISTSGNYERFIKTKKYNHLINPKTGKPQENFASITVLTKADNTIADAYSTAISVMSLEKAKKFLKNHKSVAGILITNDRRVFITKNIYSFSKVVLFFEDFPVKIIDY